jgi:alkaline phosphatase
MTFSDVSRRVLHSLLLVLGLVAFAGTALGDGLALTAPQPKLAIDRKYIAPPPFEMPLADDKSDAVPMNIILIIGDGMGTGAQKLTSLYQHQAEGRLIMQQLPVTGFFTTYSANSNVTDSAAASTAIACGPKTKNGMIGLVGKTNRIVSVTELAHKSGRSVALITSDAIVGATPGGFYAHVTGRGLYQEIADDAARCGYDLLIGSSKSKDFFMPKGAGGQRTDKRDLVQEMNEKGYVKVETGSAFAQAPHEKRVLGFLDKATLEPETALADLMTTALARFEKQEKGFLMMMECTITDAGGHGNNPELTVRGTLQVDWAVRKAVEFAQKKGDTLVLVTADHETGGLQSELNHSVPGQLKICYTTKGHTGAPVKLFAFGPGSKAFKGTHDNTEIAKTIARFWNLELAKP